MSHKDTHEEIDDFVTNVRANGCCNGFRIVPCVTLNGHLKDDKCDRDLPKIST